jgi:hypothetical protein
MVKKSGQFMVPVHNWSLTTWEGARREQLRRWSELPLERIILALEEMQRLSDSLNKPAKQ